MIRLDAHRRAGPAVAVAAVLLAAMSAGCVESDNTAVESDNTGVESDNTGPACDAACQDTGTVFGIWQMVDAAREQRTGDCAEGGSILVTPSYVRFLSCLMIGESYELTLAGDMAGNSSNDDVHWRRSYEGTGIDFAGTVRDPVSAGRWAAVSDTCDVDIRTSGYVLLDVYTIYVHATLCGRSVEFEWCPYPVFPCM